MTKFVTYKGYNIAWNDKYNGYGVYCMSIDGYSRCIDYWFNTINEAKQAIDYRKD